MNGFVLDSMLGRLTRWLRVMGYDSVYLRKLKNSTVQDLLGEGRILLSKNRRVIIRFDPSLLIYSDVISQQLNELKQKGLISSSSRNKWFTRCIVCNHPLSQASPEYARQSVPEYVFNLNMNKIRYCPGCNRYFWPGTHRANMINLLEKWGF